VVSSSPLSAEANLLVKLVAYGIDLRVLNLTAEPSGKGEGLIRLPLNLKLVLYWHCQFCGEGAECPAGLLWCKFWLSPYELGTNLTDLSGVLIQFNLQKKLCCSPGKFPRLLHLPL